MECCHPRHWNGKSMLKTKKVAYYFSLFAFFIALYGELDFRLFDHETRLEYDVHDELYWRLRPNQMGYEWLAHMTLKTPPITINSLGLRGPEIEIDAPNRYRILAIGSSSALGSGVKDEETWTAVLQEKLRARNLPVDVLNAANPGWGPFQHATLIEHEFHKYNPDVAIVMIANGDFGFLPKSTEAEKRAFLEKSRRRKRILAISPFLTYALRKSEVICTRLKNRITEIVSKATATSRENKSEKRPQVPNSCNWMRNKIYWTKIADFAEQHKFPIIFYILNPEDFAAIKDLANYLCQLASGKRFVQIVELTSRDIPVSTRQDPWTFAQRHLRIPGDGHPNIEYHRLMADRLASGTVNWEELFCNRQTQAAWVGY